MASMAEEMQAFWNGPAAERWIELQPVLDRSLEPFGRAAMDAAALSHGGGVLDLGCGTGATVIELAARVGSGGSVTGLDVSAPMLEVARERVRSAGLTNVRLVEANAATYAFEPRAFDAVVSRFGWMFFEDPALALANLLRAMRPSGRAALAAWRALGDNPWAHVPLDAVVRIVGAPPPLPPGAPGPFAFADEARARGVMEAAGWKDVALARFDAAMRLGETRSLDEAVAYTMQMGPAARALLAAGVAEDSDALARVRDALRTALSPFHEPTGVTLAASVWVVTARAP